MRYKNGVAIFVPWMDTDGNRNHSRFTFAGDVDKRRVRRMLRTTLTKLGMKPRKDYLDYLTRARSYELGS